MDELILPLLFFVIAFLYSSVGFGGGSTYLAILSIMLTEFYEIRSMALVFNLAVVVIGTSVFIKKNVFDWRQYWPFIVFSMPMAFIGAQMKLSQVVFFLILGSSLMMSGVFMLLQAIKRSSGNRRFGWLKRGFLGSAVGFISGLAGIGGGIFLSPLLNLLGWANPRIVASLASTFILFNSIAGLLGLLVSNTFHLNLELATPLLIAVMAGGVLGSVLSSNKFNMNMIRAFTAILVSYVGLRLVLQHGFDIKI